MKRKVGFSDVSQVDTFMHRYSIITMQSIMKLRFANIKRSNPTRAVL
jgi:hypothetical protein